MFFCAFRHLPHPPILYIFYVRSGTYHTFFYVLSGTYPILPFYTYFYLRSGTHHFCFMCFQALTLSSLGVSVAVLFICYRDKFEVRVRARVQHLCAGVICFLSVLSGTYPILPFYTYFYLRSGTHHIFFYVLSGTHPILSCCLDF